MVKRTVSLIIICAILLCLTGCQRQSRETIFAMDTVIDLQIWGKDSEKAMQEVQHLIKDTDLSWSAQKEGSRLSALNRGESVEDPLLDQVQALSKRTGGAFDPRLHSLMTLWGFGSEEYCVPTQEQINAAKADPKWDLGGAVKGYVGQVAASHLQNLRVSHAILNLGGNIQTYGNKPDGTPWNIGIQNPNGGDYIGTVAVVGTMSVVTSGDYQRYFEKDGVRYHHILDPETGMPAQSGLSSVTVLCRDGLTADCLSTALFVMGLEQGSAFWQQSDDFEAVFITTEGKVYATQGVALSGCEYEVIDREN